MSVANSRRHAAAQPARPDAPFPLRLFVCFLCCCQRCHGLQWIAHAQQACMSMQFAARVTHHMFPRNATPRRICLPTHLLDLLLI
jgi:hypothetical protein